MLYALVIFFSAFLLFLVQPLIAKQILPWFGGSASVWATCMLFFQTALLAGYAYADALTRWCSLKRQAQIHTVMLVCAVALMPIIVAGHWRPQGEEEPISRILMLLGATIGLPYFLLASTTPLVGAWFWRRHQSAAPYRLFALSNFASLLALLGFPFLFEPWFGNRGIALVWSGLYAVFALLCITLAWRTALRVTDGIPESGPAEVVAPTATDRAAHGAPSRTWLTGWPMWVTLSALGSMTLLAVSNHLTQNISSAPLLWVVPLALYLVTFIICFDHPRWYVRSIFLPLAAIALPAMAATSDSLELAKVTPLYAAGMFVLCMVFHGELASLKPAPRQLTQYYLWMAVGGALGSLLIAVAAPLLLDGYFELFIVLLIAVVVIALHTFRVPGGRLWRASLQGVCLLVFGGVAYYSVVSTDAYVSNVRFMERDFYGVVRTRDSGGEPEFRTLIHGGISHGGQLTAPEQQMLPSSYFGPNSGYGKVFQALPDQPRRVGIVGLGAGSLAAWARTGDHWVFYEISPAVVRAAKQEFTFLSKMPGTHEIVVGDGRLALEREAPRGYDVIAMDAFAGDSVPTHLVTREAMAAYVKHLKPDGVIVFQATNRFVNLLPPIRNLADEFGMSAVVVEDNPVAGEGNDPWLSATEQVLVTRNKAFLQNPLVRDASVAIQRNPNLPIFTDDYVNLLRILKR